MQRIGRISTPGHDERWPKRSSSPTVTRAWTKS